MKNSLKLSSGLITLFIFAAYFNCLQNEFLWDDEFLIQKNTYLTDIKYLPKILLSNSTAGFGGKDNFYRPTQNLFYLFIYQFFGPSEIAFHLGNIIIHWLNALLILLFIKKLTNNINLAFGTSLLWACHPTHVEAVSYISGTADPLSLLFCLASLLIFPELPLKSESWKKYFFSLIFFTLSLLSKESLIIFPGLLILVILLRKLLSSKDVKLSIKEILSPFIITLPFWLTAFSYLLIRKYCLNFDETYQFFKKSNLYTENILYRVYTSLATLPEYLGILFYPTRLHMERYFPVFTEITDDKVLIGLLIFVLSFTTSFLLLWQKKIKLPLFCWLWFFVAFIPMSGILVPINSFILEHWLYLPSLGFFLTLSLCLEQADRGKIKITLILYLLLASTLGFLTYKRNQDWAHPVIFYENILKYSRGTARVHNNLAMAYSSIGHWNKAIKHYSKAIEISDTYPQTRYNLARALIQAQQYDKALLQLNRSLEIDPHFSYATKLPEELLNYLKDAQKRK